MPSLPIQSWLDLERRFRQLYAESTLQGLRLDFQWGSAGEHWNLTGVQRGVKYQEAEALSALAGRALSFSLAQQSEPEGEILAYQDPAHRWFRAVVELGGAASHPRVAYELDDNGNRVGTIQSATIQEYLEVSANLCLHLASACPIRDPRSWSERLYEDFGKQILVGGIVAFIGALIGWAFGTWA